jgi:Raf kinase inhibitor-like YbhB/YbcL family protein
MLNSFGCTGGNKSPQLAWSGAPAGAKSFVLTMYDADAPTGSGFWHWVVYNIPADATGLPPAIGQGGALPAGAVQGKNDGGRPSYAGPCPPQGGPAHRYVFTLHALKAEKLTVPPDASPAMVGLMTAANRIGQTSLTVKVER